MKQVQEALKNLGIPVMAGVWRATSANQNPPVQYAVYSTTTTEASHQDDHVTSYRTFVYLNLWSDVDPTETANHIRAAMYDAGFFHGGGVGQRLQSARVRHRHHTVHGAVDVVLAGGGDARWPLTCRALTIS